MKIDDIAKDLAAAVGELGVSVSEGDVRLALLRYLAGHRAAVARDASIRRALRAAVFDAEVDRGDADPPMTREEVERIVEAHIDDAARRELNVVEMIETVGLQLLQGGARR